MFLCRWKGYRRQGVLKRLVCLNIYEIFREFLVEKKKFFFAKNYKKLKYLSSFFKEAPLLLLVKYAEIKPNPFMLEDVK